VRKLTDLLKSSEFVSNVVKLVSWTVAAQTLYVVFLPVLTRLFTKEDFGRLGILSATSACLIIVTGFRYEVAVLLPEDDDEAFNLVGLTGLVMLCTSAVTVLFCLFGPTHWVFRGNLRFLADVWWLLPMYQLGATGNELLTNWAIRRQAFDIVARTKIAQVVCQLVIQLGLGFARVGSLGLYIGDVVGRLGGTTSLASLVWRRDRSLLRKLSWGTMRRMASQYRRFPMFASGAALMGVASRQLPTIVIGTLFSPAAAGAYNLAQRVLAAPMELICRAYTQVYLGEGSRLSREDPEGMRRLFVKSGRRLFVLGVVPAMVVMAFGPWLFAFAFGPQWREAGVYARLLSVKLFVDFVSFPLVHTLNILEKQNWQAVWDFATLLLAVGGVIALALLGASPHSAILYYSCAMAAMFGVHFVLSYVAIGQRIRDFAAKGACA
jgi:O-antigen/teichoic acid export membrane protein